MAWERDVVMGAGGAALTAIAALTTAYLEYFNKDRELDIRMVEIALSILREDPDKSKIKAARG